MTEQRPLAEPKAIADFLGTTPQQLAQYRYLGKGPRYIKVGKRVRYRWSDVEAWLTDNTRTTTGAA
ncbi:helix-turn-helix transcriptional regulator [Nocardia sp. NPDC058705]|uniref:helix-turn-helix transcriptional regulator n=1 Tax=Nocardia sp. NPDC058705 TaxID=3346609 RepID=UPI0036C3D420